MLVTVLIKIPCMLIIAIPFLDYTLFMTHYIVTTPSASKLARKYALNYPQAVVDSELLISGLSIKEFS